MHIGIVNDSPMRVASIAMGFVSMHIGIITDSPMRVASIAMGFVTDAYRHHYRLADARSIYSDGIRHRCI